MNYDKSSFSFIKKINDLQNKNSTQNLNDDIKNKKFFSQAGNLCINPYLQQQNLPSKILLSSNYKTNPRTEYYKNYSNIFQKKFEKNYSEYQINNFNIDKEQDLRELNYIISSKVGLENLGNTCYMNTCLQILIHSKDFIQRLLLKKQFINDITTPITKQFLNLCEKIENSGKNFIDPSDFKKIISKKHPQFKGYSQFDTQEFCRILLEDINYELNEIKNKMDYRELSTEGKSKIQCNKEFDQLFRSRESSIIIDSFYAQIVNILKCRNKFESYSFEKILDLPLLLPENIERIELNKLINNFFLEEKIRYSKKCKNCKHRTHKKEIKITQSPNILILSLQRINERTMKKNKSRVDFEEKLNLQNYIDVDCGNEYLYNLYGVGCHSGDINFGHYFAYIKLNDKDWHEFNDSKVKYVGDDYYTKSSLYVYVLFYKKICNNNY